MKLQVCFLLLLFETVKGKQLFPEIRDTDDPTTAAVKRGMLIFIIQGNFCKLNSSIKISKNKLTLIDKSIYCLTFNFS